jgi:hypothetical protein
VQKMHTKVLLLFHFRSCDGAIYGSLEAPFAVGKHQSCERVLLGIRVSGMSPCEGC